MPAVSICLPVYNGARYLSKALHSALSQSYEDFELLIADDRSTDGTAEIIDTYAKNDERIKAWTNDRNLGHYGNYNACINRASGRYIKLFAQDDILHPSILERSVAVMKGHPNVALVNCARRWINNLGQRIEAQSKVDLLLTKPFSEDRLLLGSEAIVSVFQQITNWLGEPSSQMYRAEFIDGGFDETFRQIGDLEHNIRVLNNGDFYFIKDELCEFRKHTDSWTTANSFVLNTHLEWLLLASKHRDYLTRAGLTSEQFCLNFLKDWTRNLEEQLYQENRLGKQDLDIVLRELCEQVDPISLFQGQKNAKRDNAAEYRAFGASALLQAVVLENQLRLTNAELARSYDDNKESPEALLTTRPGMVAAMQGLKNTLRERDKEIEALRQALEEMGNSFSWKVTAPLRRLKAQLR